MFTSGKLRALAVVGPKRTPALPEYPTVAESGVPGFDTTSWFGLFCAARTPKEIVDKINHDVTAVLNAPELRARLLEQGQEVVASTSEEFAAFVRSQVTSLADLIKASGARVD